MASSDIMQAAVLDAPNTAFRVGPVARPKPGNGQVLVRIAASGVNPLDTKIYAGQAAHAKHPPPGILGINMAGVLEAIGPGVTGSGAAMKSMG
jgi:NADPH:quinone reductase